MLSLKHASFFYQCNFWHFFEVEKLKIARKELVLNRIDRDIIFILFYKRAQYPTS